MYFIYIIYIDYIYLYNSSVAPLVSVVSAAGAADAALPAVIHGQKIGRSINGGTPKMDGLYWQILSKWMIWEYAWLPLV